MDWFEHARPQPRPAALRGRAGKVRAVAGALALVASAGCASDAPISPEEARDLASLEASDEEQRVQEELQAVVQELANARSEGRSIPRGIESQDLEPARAAEVAAVAAADQPFIYASNTYGYAGATFDWAAANRVSNIDLIVSDWECDAKPVYAYFLWHDGSRWDETPTHRYDHSGCDTGDHSTYNNLSWSVSGTNIYYMAAVLCREGGPCKVGAVSERNPRAPH